MKQKALLIMLLATVLTAKSADYYWVGGTGNWTDVATHWATTSGGGTFQVVVPTSLDNVFFDANSFTGASQAVTGNIGTVSCNNMSWTGVTNSPTFNMQNNNLYIYSSLTLVAGMTASNFGNGGNGVFFASTATGQTITTGGQSVGQVYLIGVGGGWTLQDAITAPGGIFLQSGSFITNNQTLTILYFSSQTSNIRSLNLGTSTINLSFSNPWTISGSNFTYVASSPTINESGGGTFIGGGYAYYDINFTGSGAGTISGVSSAHDVSFGGNGTINGATFNNVTFGGNATINGSNTFNNISFGAGKVNTFQASTTQTVNGTFTSGSSCTGFSTFTSSTSSAATISKSSGSVIVNYVNLSNITGTGGATFTANNTIASGTNTGWTVSPLSSNNLYWIGGTGNWNDGSHWSLTSGGAAYNCSPTLLDNVFFDANSFTGASQTVTGNIATLSCNNMNWTGVTNTPTLNMNNNLLYIYGSLTMVAGMNTSNFFCCTNSITFKATSTGKTITTGGRSIGQVWLDGVGGEWTLQDALTAPGGIFLINGSFITNNQTLTVFYFSSNNSNVRNLNIGSSTINVSYGQPWELGGTNLTFSATTPTINASGGGNFIGGGRAYHNINFTGSSVGTISGVTTANDVSFTANGTVTGPSTFNNVTFGGNATINGSNTFNNLTFYSGTTNTLAAGATQTVTGTLTATGTGGFLITIQSSSASPTILSKSSGNVCFDYVRLQNITGTGGATFDAGINTHSTDLGGNTGFAFTGICTLPPYPPFLWKGATNTSWTTTTNWSPGIVPSSSSNIIISTANNAPVISTTQAVNNVTINSGTSLTVTGTLQLGGAITNNGTLTATAGTISMVGSSPQTIAASTFASNTVQNLTVNNAAGVTLAGILNVTGTLTPTAGTLTTGGFLTLKSTATGTASIGNSAGTISGNVTVERFIPAKAARKFSFVSSPITTPISTSWQTNTHITGAGTGGSVCPSLTANTNGFDATVTNAPSMLVFNGAATAGSRWGSVTNTTTTNLTPGVGYRMNVRGPRATGCGLLDGTSLIPAATTLSATGAITNTVNSGNVSVPVNSLGTGTDGYVLIGNPYPAVIDFNAFRTTNAAKIANEYKTYSPANAAGTYTTWNGGSLTNAGGLTNGQYIASGQAFFVQKLAAGADNLSFTEAHKAAQTQAGTYRTTTTWNNLVRVGMKTATDAHLDEIIIRFADEAGVTNTSLGTLDAISINEGAQKISSVKAKNSLAIQTRAANFTTDVVDLNVISTTTGSFKLLFTEFENFTGATIYLVDNYTNTTQKVNDNPVYNFDINTAIPATQAAGRFSVQFVKAITPQAIVITGIKMYPNPANKNLTVELPITEGKYTLRITDVIGKQVYQNQLAGGVQAINISKLAQGNYVVEITDAKGNRMVEKLVKQ